MAKKKTKKRVNPNRQPVNRAMVRKIAEETKDEAVSLAIALFLTVMCDKFGFDAESLQAVWAEVNDLSDSVVKGYVNVADLKQVLREEYGIEIT